jgi:hypothetical protein
MTDTIMVAEPDDESSGYRFSWGLAIAGGVAATAVTFFLLTLGSGFGLLLVHPTTDSGSASPVFLTAGAIYFFVAQAFGFVVGGHLAGRLLAPLFESEVQENFRAAAHGFIAWAVAILATLTMVALAGMAASNNAATTAGLYGASASKSTNVTPTAYLVDVLFQPNTSSNENARAEAGRILDAGLARGEVITPDDHERLTIIVAQQAGIGRDRAAERIDQMQADIQAKTKHAANVARKAASYTSLWIAVSLLFGAVLAVFAAVTARHEDDRDVAEGRAFER